jgi:hypothetical protein
MPKLKNRKRETFAIEVAAMTPLDRAYVLAGYSDTPWARYNASKLAHIAEVAARIDELQMQFAERSGIYAEYIQRKLLPVIEANVADLFEPRTNATGEADGYRLKPISEMPRDLAAAISKIKCDPETGAVTDVSLYSKLEAGSTLLRSVGALKDEAVVQIARIERVIVAAAVANTIVAQGAGEASATATTRPGLDPRIAALLRPKVGGDNVSGA